MCVVGGGVKEVASLEVPMLDDQILQEIEAAIEHAIGAVAKSGPLPNAADMIKLIGSHLQCPRQQSNVKYAQGAASNAAAAEAAVAQSQYDANETLKWSMESWVRQLCSVDKHKGCSVVDALSQPLLAPLLSPNSGSARPSAKEQLAFVQSLGQLSVSEGRAAFLELLHTGNFLEALSDSLYKGARALMPAIETDDSNGSRRDPPAPADVSMISEELSAMIGRQELPSGEAAPGAPGGIAKCLLIDARCNVGPREEHVLDYEGAQSSDEMEWSCLVVMRVDASVGNGRVGIAFGGRDFNFEVHEKGRLRLWWVPDGCYAQHGCSDEWRDDHFAPCDVRTGQWHVAAFTRDLQTVRIYLDGRQVYAGAAGGVRALPLCTLSGPLHIGGGHEDARRKWFQGEVARLAVYSRVLSDTEMRLLATDYLAPRVVAIHGRNGAGVDSVKFLFSNGLVTTYGGAGGGAEPPLLALEPGDHVVSVCGRKPSFSGCVASAFTATTMRGQQFHILNGAHDRFDWRFETTHAGSEIYGLQMDADGRVVGVLERPLPQGEALVCQSDVEQGYLHKIQLLKTQVATLHLPAHFKLPKVLDWAYEAQVMWLKTLAEAQAFAKQILLTSEDVQTIVAALSDKTVLNRGKPCELISGQPKSAAMGLYHFMRVQDPYAEEGTSKLEQEITSFIARIEEHAARVTQHQQLGALPIEQIPSDVLQSLSEINYFKKISWLKPEATAQDVVERVKEELLGNLNYILYEASSEKYVEGPNAVRDLGRGNMRLSDFIAHPNVKEAEMTTSHVAALRLYTTLAFKYINSPLRSLDVYYHQYKAHPLPLTVATVAEGIRKLRAAYAVKVGNDEIPPVASLWRGMKNLRMGEDFMLRDENGKCKGGTELAPMSTTTDLAVAARYASSNDSLLLKISLDNFMQYGAELKWLSAFPGEDEVLYPPLTYLQPTDKPPQTVELPGGQKYTVYEVKPTLP